MRIERNRGGKLKMVMSATVVAAMIGAAALASCAPKQAEPAASDAPEETTQMAIEWSADMDCAACHGSAFAAEGSDNQHIAAGDCFACHTEADMQEVHQGADMAGQMPTKLAKTDIANDRCLTSGCHGSLDEVVAATEGVAVSDANGTTVNPHAVLAQEHHAEVLCADCHSVHDTSADVTAAAESTCYGCHHEEIFECYTCHQ